MVKCNEETRVAIRENRFCNNTNKNKKPNTDLYEYLINNMIVCVAGVQVKGWGGGGNLIINLCVSVFVFMD